MIGRALAESTSQAGVCCLQRIYWSKHVHYNHKRAQNYKNHELFNYKSQRPRKSRILQDIVIYSTSAMLEASSTYFIPSLSQATPSIIHLKRSSKNTVALPQSYRCPSPKAHEKRSEAAWLNSQLLISNPSFPQSLTASFVMKTDLQAAASLW